MLSIFATPTEAAAATPIQLHAVQPREFEKFLTGRTSGESRWLRATGFAGNEGEFALVPGDSGGLGSVVLGLGAGRDPHAAALFSERLPAGLYALGDMPAAFAGARAAYGWAIGTYAFDK